VAAAGTSILSPYSGLEESVIWMVPPEEPMLWVAAVVFWPLITLMPVCGVTVGVTEGEVTGPVDGVVIVPSVGIGVAEGPNLTIPVENSTSGMTRMAIRMATTAMISVRDFLTLGGGGGGGKFMLSFNVLIILLSNI